MNVPTRKKGDWYHSISVFTTKNINTLSPGGKDISCVILHFYGENGAPVLAKTISKISCIGTHKGKNLYKISAWSESCAVIGDVRTFDGYENGYGKTTKSIKSITTAAFGKWGDNKIPYAHQRSESYNCVAFVDDILSWAGKDCWNERIEAMHEKYGLYIK
jgi:hypothetical protein